MVEKIQEVKDVHLIQEKLGDVNKLIAPYKLAYVSPIDDCVPLEKNAHYMEKSTLDRLTANVAEDGFLSQLPFAMKRDDGKYLILSGNHRLKAAIKAKLEYILILYIEEVDKDKQIAGHDGCKQNQQELFLGITFFTIKPKIKQSHHIH